jgi:predicted GNAT family N-acyltransferase
VAVEQPPKRVIERFDKTRHSREGFSCEVECIERYFKTQAGQDAKKGLAAIYVMSEGGANVLGYYTLSSYTIDAGELPDEAARKLLAYPKFPAILIGRLARDQKYRGHGIGPELLRDALHRSLESSKSVGATAVVVEAENEKARQLYLEYGFIQFSDHANKLFLPMKTVETALA